jgi:hypothetical protein
MTTDRDRVNAALDAWFGEGDWHTRNVTFQEKMFRALAAADALAPLRVPFNSLARLARAREALDERTFHSDYQVSVWSQELDGLRKCAAIVRALADTDPAGRAALAAEETQQ